MDPVLGRSKGDSKMVAIERGDKHLIINSGHHRREAASDFNCDCCAFSRSINESTNLNF